MTRFFRVGLVLGKPWAWIKDAEPDKQTDPKFVVKNAKNKVRMLGNNVMKNHTT